MPTKKIVNQIFEILKSEVKESSPNILHYDEGMVRALGKQLRRDDKMRKDPRVQVIE